MPVRLLDYVVAGDLDKVNAHLDANLPVDAQSVLVAAVADDACMLRRLLAAGGSDRLINSNSLVKQNHTREIITDFRNDRQRIQREVREGKVVQAKGYRAEEPMRTDGRRSNFVWTRVAGNEDAFDDDAASERRALACLSGGLLRAPCERVWVSSRGDMDVRLLESKVIRSVTPTQRRLYADESVQGFVVPSASIAFVFDSAVLDERSRRTRTVADVVDEVIDSLPDDITLSQLVDELDCARADADDREWLEERLRQRQLGRVADDPRQRLIDEYFGSKRLRTGDSLVEAMRRMRLV